ncbi:MAG: DUF2089 family protein [Planctomycetaceae bacterium]|nr:DUF2089 family protein [Planctomycetaceae bacterium]
MDSFRRYPQWLELLSDEDLAFVRRLVLASGSLKAIAAEYDVSYPTIRLRLDRLIERIRLVERFAIETPMEQALRIAFAEGRMDQETFKALIALHRQDRPHSAALQAAAPPPGVVVPPIPEPPAPPAPPAALSHIAPQTFVSKLSVI